jgi:hypothetical protein
MLTEKPPPRIFGYVDNGPNRHMKAERFVIISIATLRLDFATAMQALRKQRPTLI